MLGFPLAILRALVAVTLLGFSLMACSADTAVTSTGSEAASAKADPRADEPAPASAVEPKLAEPEPAKLGPTIVHVKERTVALQELVAEHAAKAKQAGLPAYVVFSADWCRPCAGFKKHIDEASVQAAMAGIYLLMIETDAYNPEDIGIPMMIPVWWELDEHGARTGRSITSSVWEEDIPENMAPKLDAFFHPKT